MLGALGLLVLSTGCIVPSAKQPKSRSAGTYTDHARALAFYERGCDGGELRSCTALGLMHENGEGVEPDVGQAEACERAKAPPVVAPPP